MGIAHSRPISLIAQAVFDAWPRNQKIKQKLKGCALIARTFHLATAATVSALVRATQRQMGTTPYSFKIFFAFLENDRFSSWTSDRTAAIKASLDELVCGRKCEGTQAMGATRVVSDSALERVWLCGDHWSPCRRSTAARLPRSSVRAVLLGLCLLAVAGEVSRLQAGLIHLSTAGFERWQRPSPLMWVCDVQPEFRLAMGTEQSAKFEWYGETTGMPVPVVSRPPREPERPTPSPPVHPPAPKKRLSVLLGTSPPAGMDRDQARSPTPAGPSALFRSCRHQVPVVIYWRARIRERFSADLRPSSIIHPPRA